LGLFREIPLGSVVIGNEGLVRDWDGGSFDEHAANGPRRTARLDRSIAMLETPVTVAAFRMMGFAQCLRDERVFVLPRSRSISDRWEVRAFDLVNNRDELPVVGVTWDDANAFCVAASARFGRLVRLPTEIEWEFAARAGASSVYAWGDDVRDGIRYAWSDRNSESVVQPVAKLLPNAWGLFDMAGNVWEWCSNRFDPHAVSDRKFERAIRGGSACHHATAGRCAHRFGMRVSQRNAFLGFRCVIELDAAECRGGVLS
jgi:formylglycine-generating enzyme required for sulfatase activity